MAFIVPRKNGSWEIRESHSTPRGPRSRTLATFRVLDDETIERARGKASAPLSAEELNDAAERVGAPIAKSPVEDAASKLIAAMYRGKQPRRALRRLLADAIDPREAGLSPEAKAAQEWVAASPEERGETLFDLLLLADALPQRRRSDRSEFPPLKRRPR